MIESNKSDAIPLIRGYIAQHFTTNKAAAPELGISEVHLSRILNKDNVDIPDSLLDLIGWEKTTHVEYKIKDCK